MKPVWKRGNSSTTRYLGSPLGYPLLYYDFVWSGAKDSYRGTQKLLVFDHADRYLGYYYLHEALTVTRCRIDGQRALLVFDDGKHDELDFATGLPEYSVSGQILYHPAGP